jgi:hypothetical protein
MITIKELARKAFREQISQDNEGGVPCGVSFVGGYMKGHKEREEEFIRMENAWREKIKKEIIKNEILMQAVKFYADRENWVFSYSLNSGINYREIINTDTYGMPSPKHKDGAYFGGKTARMALKQIEELK